MVHGEKDEVVPLSFSKKVLAIFPSSKKNLLVIKNGDHSLSTPADLERLSRELQSLIQNIYS